MKRLGWLFLVCLFTPFLFGMGPLQGPATPEKIPTPVKKYTATFIDQMDVVTECTEVSIEGATYFDGKKGEGSYTVSFDNVEQVLFRLNKEKLIGTLTLRDGTTIELTLNKGHNVYGRTKYGTFQIKLTDLKKLVLVPVKQTK